VAELMELWGDGGRAAALAVLGSAEEAAAAQLGVCNAGGC